MSTGPNRNYGATGPTGVTGMTGVTAAMTPLDFKRQEFYNQVRNNDIEGCRRKLEEGIVVNDKSHPVFASSAHQCLAVGIAARHGYYRLTEFLLDGASLSELDVDRTTPLHEAAIGGHCEIMSLLLERGGYSLLELADGCGFTALHHAAQQGQLEACDLLLKKGANVNARDKEGRTPLFFALCNKSPSCARLLLKRRPIDEIQAGMKLRPIHLAAKYGLLTICQKLVKRGCDVSVKDEEGKTPFLFAALNGHAEVCRYLNRLM